MTHLSLSNISKSYGTNKVLTDISLDVEEGEFISLVGESGCGKSTLLRILAGLETPDTGEVALAGRIVNTLAPKQRNIAMVFQDYALYPHMTVGENLATPLLMARLPLSARLPFIRSLSGTFRAARGDIRQRVAETARQLQIEHLLDRRPAQLSGGQRQRVALGRALVRNPTLFLMDEPLSNLDAKLRVSVRGEITELHRSSGLTFVYVTHDQVEALTMSTRVAMMDKGRLLQVGTPGDLYDSPATLYVARFVGSPEITVLPAEARNGRVFIGQMALPLGTSATGPVFVGIRPEMLSLAGLAAGTSGPDGPVIRFSFKARSVEDLGHELLVYGEVAECPDAAVRVRVQKGPQSAGWERGGRVGTLTAAASALHLFDREGRRLSGERIGAMSAPELV